MRFPAWSLSGRTCGPAQNQRCLHNSGHRCDQRRNERAQPCRRAGKTSSTNGPALLSAAYGGTPAPRQHTTLPNTATPPGRSRRCSSRGAGRSGTGRGEAGRSGGREETPPAPAAHRAAHAAPARRRAGGKRRPPGGAWASSRCAALHYNTPLHTGAGGERAERLEAAAAAAAARGPLRPRGAVRGCTAGAAGG